MTTETRAVPTTRLAEEQVEATLRSIEATLARGEPVDARGSGFWRAVAAVKRNPAWIERYAERIAVIDQALFDRAFKVTLPEGVGLALFSFGTLSGLLLAAIAAALPAPLNGLVYLAGSAALIGASHDLAHYLVGRAVGLRFSGWYAAKLPMPQPGLKIEYASYLRTPPRARAWMHASGALVTKALPFVLAIAGLPLGAPAWALRLLAAAGLFQVATDLTFSRRLSDWKRFSREMRVARELGE